MKMNLFKYYLGHILGNYEEEKSQRELEKSQKLCPMSLHRQQFRNLIGEILMQPVDLGSPGPYIPFFYLMDTTRQLGEVAASHHFVFFAIIFFLPESSHAAASLPFVLCYIDGTSIK